MNTSSRPTLLVGACDRAARARITGSALAPGSVLEVFERASEGAEWLEQCEPLAVLVALPPAEAEGFLLGLRAVSRLRHTPVIVLSDEVTDLTFAQAFTWGADDAVPPRDVDGLNRRLRIIPAELSLKEPPARGTAVLANADQKERVLLARVLHNAGFEVRFEVDAHELTQAAEAKDVALVVVQATIDGGGALEVLRKMRAHGNAVPWILTAPPDKLVSTAAAVAGLPSVAVHDSFAPAENLLFLTNEILSGSFAEQRSSARLLFGALVAFRVAGRDSDRLAYSYNVSGDGLFVRTLDPPARGDEVWLEFTPPRTDRRVRLEGTVRWVRPLVPSAVATVPPGFGVQIASGLGSDWDRFRQGYKAFARAIAGMRFSSSPAGPLSQ